jgi:hypothetical protein
LSSAATSRAVNKTPEPSRSRSDSVIGRGRSRRHALQYDARAALACERTPPRASPERVPSRRSGSRAWRGRALSRPAPAGPIRCRHA